MLYTMIVDDEEIVRHGLRFHYDWSKYDLEVVGDFSDGKSAWDYLLQHHVDLLVTDVVMPNMDGITLAQKARELYPDIKIIFVSGHSDVQYLWNALKMNAVDYIFKSVDFRELDEAIERVIHLVEQQNQEKERLRQIELQLRENQTVLRQQQLVFLLSWTNETEEELSHSCSALSIPLNSRSTYVIMLLRLSNKWNLLDERNDCAGILLDIKLQNALEDFFRSHGSEILFKKRAYEYISILNADMEDMAEVVMDLSEEVQTHMMHHFNASFTIGISEPFKGLTQIREAYKNASNAIFNRYVVDDTLPQITLKKYESRENLNNLQEKHRLEICNAILDGQADRIQEVCHQAVSEGLHLASVNEQQNHLLYLLMIPQYILRDLPVGKRGAYSSYRILIERYLLCQDEHEQEEFLLRSFLDVSGTLHGEELHQSNTVIKNVCAYIHEHYMEQLSILMLAENAYLTPTYLCVLFKKNMGQTLNNYITDVRLEEARRMLSQSNCHLQDICYRVGYLSPSYFSRLFRKKFGLSPSEYRATLSV